MELEELCVEEEGKELCADDGEEFEAVEEELTELLRAEDALLLCCELAAELEFVEDALLPEDALLLCCELEAELEFVEDALALSEDPLF